MTRINAFVPPENLCDQMLIAEHREIKRIPNTIRSGKAILKTIPAQFKLGTGHVKFFYDKLGYLRNRYALLLLECRRRGFNVTDYSSVFSGIGEDLMGDFDFCAESKRLVEERIEQKLG